MINSNEINITGVIEDNDVDLYGSFDLRGPQGPQGPQGEKGERGEQGEIGPQGIQGKTGAGLNIISNLSSSDELPINANNGDAYIIDGDLWVYSGKWENVGKIEGPQGPQGEQGIQGIQGEQGEQGIQGEQGTDGYTPKKGIDYFTENDIKSLNIPTKVSQLDNDEFYAKSRDVNSSISAVQESFQNEIDTINATMATVKKISDEDLANYL